MQEINKPSKKWIYGCFFSFLFAGFLPGCAEKTASPMRPNIVLVMCDDLGWGDVGFNGNSFVQTPHLDELASRGIIFERFYSASPVCSPTRASCLTGRNPNRMGIPNANSGHMKEEEITLAELLKAHGYATGHFGKWHLGTLTTRIKDANRGRPGDSSHYSTPGMNGFDVYFSTESKVPTYDPMIFPDIFDTARGENKRFGWAAIQDRTQALPYGTYYWEGAEQQVTDNLEGDNSRLTVDRAIPFIEKAVSDQTPFFSVIWFHTPHLPVVADASHRQLYDSLSHRERIYYGTITAMDEQVGRLWEKLEALGIAQNTMLWFASDNGPERNTPGSAGPFRERKRSLYEGGVRIPAFCIWPDKIPQGGRTNLPAVTSDYLPTIADYLDIPFPDDRPIDGISIRGILSDIQKQRNRPIGFLFHEKMSWVTDQYKLISTDGGQNFELYDLQADPEEQHNVISDHSERSADMKKALMKWLASCEASEAGKDY